MTKIHGGQMPLWSDFRFLLDFCEFPLIFLMVLRGGGAGQAAGESRNTRAFNRNSIKIENRTIEAFASRGFFSYGSCESAGAIIICKEN